MSTRVLMVGFFILPTWFSPVEFGWKTQTLVIDLGCGEFRCLLMLLPQVNQSHPVPKQATTRFIYNMPMLIESSEEKSPTKGTFLKYASHKSGFKV